MAVSARTVVTDAVIAGRRLLRRFGEASAHLGAMLGPVRIVPARGSSRWVGKAKADEANATRRRATLASIVLVRWSQG